jgi:hypothetical protein
MSRFNLRSRLKVVAFTAIVRLVNGKQFIRRAAKWSKARGKELVVDASRGKGGHQMVRIGDRWTTVQTGELKPGIFHAMLKQLGIPKDEF